MLNGSTVFAQIISAPLVQLPVMLASAIDAFVALRRIGTFMRAEELAVPYTIDPKSDVALDVDGDFTWEEVRKEDAGAVKDPATKATADGGNDAAPTLPTTAPPDDQAQEKEQEKEKPPDKPFELKDLKLRIPKGAFVAIVGRVGSGKSSVLQALIGEMRKTRGNVSTYFVWL